MAATVVVQVWACEGSPRNPSWRCVCTLTGYHSRPIYSIDWCWSEGCDWIVTGDGDNTLQVFQPADTEGAGATEGKVGVGLGRCCVCDDAEVVAAHILNATNTCMRIGQQFLMNSPTEILPVCFNVSAHNLYFFLPCRLTPHGSKWHPWRRPIPLTSTACGGTLKSQACWQLRVTMGW